MDPGNASMLTLVKAMAVLKGIEEITGLHPEIKWPNDIVLNKKKICGMLTEMTMTPEMDEIQYIVVGAGRICLRRFLCALRIITKRF